MQTIKIQPNGTVWIGRRGEHGVRRVAVDISCWIAEFGDGTFELLVQRVEDTAPSPVAVDVEDDVVLWPITSWETEKAGDGVAELRLYTGGNLAKSATVLFRVSEALNVLEDPTTPAAQAWGEQVLQAGAEAKAYAAQAQESAGKAAQAAKEIVELAAAVDDHAQGAEAAREAAEKAQGLAEDAQRAAAEAETAANEASGAAAQSASNASDSQSAAANAAVRAETAAVNAAQALADLQALADTVSGYAAQAASAASLAQTASQTAQGYSSHPPVIGEGDLWYLWDGTQYAASDHSSSGLPDVVSVPGTELALTLESNTEYRCSELLASLTIAGFSAGAAGKAELWSIVWTAGEAITVTVPSSVVWAVAQPVFTAGATYWISVVPLGDKYLAAWTEVEADE